MKIDGGCLCGHITYEAEVNPEKVTICHCTDCQTLSGSAFRIGAATPDTAFKLLSGEPKTYIKTADSGAKRAQVFCPNCGTQIYSTSVGEGPKVLRLRVATARQRYDLPPKAQGWVRSSQAWLGDLETIAKSDRQPANAR
jgi:hypothetical protein